MNEENKKIQVTIKNIEKSAIEIEGKISAEEFNKYEAKAIKMLGENLEIAGFRKGHIPENILLKTIPEMKILEEMAQMALDEHYPSILVNEKIDAIGRPEISITKLAKNNPLAFKITTSVMPKIELPDYKNIAKKENTLKQEVTVTEEDIEKTIMEIRKMRAHKDAHEKEGHAHKEGEEHGEIKEEDLPVFDDNFVKGLGGFTDLEDFRKKLKDNLHFEKQSKEREKIRLAIAGKIINGIKTEIPQIFIDIETDKMISRIKGDLQMVGLSFEDYLKHLKKTEEEMRKDMEKDAEKQAKLQLAIVEIAGKENIKPNEEDLKKESELILMQHKEADPERVKSYVENILTNEKVFQFLENLS